jgi:hypothetical protein
MNQKVPASSKTARVNRPERFQIEMQLMALDEMLPRDHRARLVTLDSIGQDGMRVRASAGASSFRRRESLEKLHAAAGEYVEKLHGQRADDSDEDDPTPRQRAARERVACERAQRIAEAIKQVEELHDQKEKRKKGDGKNARCSTTDPDARRMKMGDGGTRPAYNFQFTASPSREWKSIQKHLILRSPT